MAMGPNDRLVSAMPDGTPAKTRVLVVDDNADLRETLRSMLGLSGFDVATAAGGETAIEMARLYRPDVVVMDLCMPGLDGFAAAKQMRAEPDGESLALVSMSALPESDAAGWSRRAGFDFHLPKPTGLAELVATLLRAASARTRTRG
jgi:two-component system, sensor histidine kinase